MTDFLDLSKLESGTGESRTKRHQQLSPQCLSLGLSTWDFKKCLICLYLLLYDGDWKDGPLHLKVHQCAFSSTNPCVMASVRGHSCVAGLVPRVWPSAIFTVTAGWPPWQGCVETSDIQRLVDWDTVNSQLWYRHFPMFCQTKPPARHDCRSWLIIWLN